jgi:hypothetical protein
MKRTRSSPRLSPPTQRVLPHISVRKTKRRSPSSPGIVKFTKDNMYPKVHTNPIVVRGSVKPYYFDMEPDTKRSKSDSQDTPLEQELYDQDGTQPFEQELYPKNRGGLRYKRLCRF